MNRDLMPKILIFSIIIINITSILIYKEINVIGIIASIMGVTSVVLSAKGHIGCYYTGIVTNITYTVIAFNSHFYGTAILQAFIFLPMQFIGIANWRKNLQENSNIVKTKKMDLSKIYLLIIGSFIFTILYSLGLNFISGNLPFIDATITSLSLIAMTLSIRRYKEQWPFWIIVNFINVIMWFIAFIDKMDNSLLMIFTWFLYFINSIYGYINWNKLIEQKKEV